MPEKMWTPEKAAKILNIIPQTVGQYLRNGTIKGVKVARKWLIPDSDLQAYIDGLKAKRDAREYARDHVLDDDPPVLIVWFTALTIR